MSYDLLNDSLIQTDRGWCDLPGLLAAMARGKVAAFPALRPHQRPAWHMFLVQLATLALDGAGLRDLPHDAESWRAALRGLSADFPGDEPWHLVVADRAKPGFLQPPDPEGLKWTPVATPDALDMLITSRNHDLKREIAHEAAPQDWLFALVSLQTMEGFGGAGNYGIARMNGGSSSRVLLGLAPGVGQSSVVDPSAWWARDVMALLGRRSGPAGKALLWLDPWRDGKMLDLAGLDPLFIEICRRVRLTETAGGIAAERSTSKAARIAAKEAKGNLGDPWAPIHTTESKSLTLGDRDWSADLLVQLLFSGKNEWAKPFLAEMHPGDSDRPMLLIAEAFARGNSKTDGFKSRVVPIPQAILPGGFYPAVVQVAASVLGDIASVTKTLRSALRLVACNGDRDKRAAAMGSQSVRARLDGYGQSALDALRQQAEEWFFPELWRRAQVSRDDEIGALRLDFFERLAGVARREFRAALPGIPCVSLLRPKAEARGWEDLERGLHFALRDLKKEEATDA